MASLLDQYEATMSRNVGPKISSTSTNATSEPISSGYVSARLEDDTPIFNKSKINFKPQEPITHLTICNNWLYMIMSGRILLRIHLLKPDDEFQTEVTRGNDKVYKIFLDPTGHFLLICLRSEETLFLSSNSQKPKSLNKFKGHKIDSVAWCRTASGNTTGPILVGTNWGLIMECLIEAGEETKFFGGSVDQYFKQVFNFGKGDGKNLSVFGLEYFCTAVRDNGKNDYCIFAITSSRLFQFSGSININSGDVPVFGPLFASYQKTPPRCTELFGFLERSQLILNYDTKSPAARVPSQFAWLAARGVYVGNVKSAQVTDEAMLQQRSLITNAKLIPYPESANDVTNPFADLEEDGQVLNVVLTEFHILLLYRDRIKVICVLNEQIIFEDIYTSRYGQLVGLIKDPLLGSIWAYTERAVFKYKVVKESRDVWQMYLDMGKFELAREYCRDNPANLDKVLTRQAEDAFEKEKYQESAMYYAITHNSFEETALKFINIDQEAALRTFLQKKMGTLKPADTVQITLLSTWLVELHLNNLGKLRDLDESSDAFNKARENFRKMLSFNKLKESFQLNKSTIYNLLISHGDIEDYIFFAVLMQDYERVVNHHIQNENYLAALEALKKQNNIPLYYQFSPVLMQHIPIETAEAWIERGRNLEPRQLIPSLVNSTRTEASYKFQWEAAIRYLEFCIDDLGCTDQAIHNYLLSLYVKQKPESLLTYLKKQRDFSETVCYDVKYALRLCLGDGNENTSPVLHRACVIIYTELKLYEEAVMMALKVDVELAKSIADSCLDDEDVELKKKLWLKIAKHVVQEEKDIKKAMMFLQDSRDLLKIEDILPFFPDFVTIDHFKDALCEALNEYNKQIDDLKEEMNDASASAESIRGNIQETKNRHLVVGDTERCAVCDKQLLSRAFYIFPCNHTFHSDCFWREVRPLLDDSMRMEADQIYQDLVALNQLQPATNEETQRQRRLKRQKLMQQLDEIIACECVLCGQIAVNAIDKPFYEGDEEEWS